MLYYRSNNIKGFTLIELLVVISIIGLLSSVVLASLNSARAKARDAQRKSIMHTIENALALYYDKYGAYPTFDVNSPCHYNGWCIDSTDYTGDTAVPNWIPGLQEFLPSIQRNPKPYSTETSGGPFHYIFLGKNKYMLMVGLENTKDKVTCGGGAIYYYDDNILNPMCGPWGDGLYVRSVK